MNWLTTLFAVRPQITVPGVCVDGASYHGLTLSTATRQLADIVASSDASSWAEAESDFAEFWLTVATVMQACQSPERLFTRVIVEARADAGTYGARLIDERNPIRASPATVALHFAFLEQAASTLFDTADDFDAAIREVLAQGRDQALRAANRVDIASVLAALHRDTGLTVSFDWSSEGDVVRL